MNVTLFDTVDSAVARMTSDGYLVGEAKVARTGIQIYLARELGISDGDPDRQIKVYRPESEVFNTDAMTSYAYRPLTVDHPPEMVNADNWKDYARGQTGPEVARDGQFIRVPLVLMDSNAINEWREGKRELSMGYTSDVEFEDGVTPEGERFDAIQKNLRMNHLALVARARGGSELKLGDVNHQEVKTMSDVKLKTVLVDGLSVETTDAGAQAIDKLQSELNALKDQFSDAETQHSDALAEKDKEIATKDAEIDDLKSKALSDKDLDTIVKDRADLIAKAKRVADIDYSGKSVDEIRRAAVVSKLGDEAIDGKSEAYVEARFDSLIDALPDDFRQATRSGVGSTVTKDHGYSGYVDRLKNAYKGATSEKVN